MTGTMRFLVRVALALLAMWQLHSHVIGDATWALPVALALAIVAVMPWEFKP